MITISVGQALLVLLEKFPNSLELKKLYLTGAATSQARLELNKWLQHEILSSFHVSPDPLIIYSDPARRYFETKLAYASLKNTLKKLSIHDLFNYTQALWSTHRKVCSSQEMVKLRYVIKGHLGGHLVSDYIRYLETKRYFSELSTKSRDKIIAVVSIFYLSIKLTHKLNDFLPLNIYTDQHIFYGVTGRGREEKLDQTCRSHALGIIKSTMPISVNDVVYSPIKSKNTRMPDSFDYDLRAKWIKYNFEQLVHPFSTSISGTMLCQLRVMSHYKNRASFPFKTRQKLAPLLTCMIAARLFYTGGHTLFEFASPLGLPEIKKDFKCIKKFSTINLEYMFYQKNKYAFATTLKDTVRYNRQLIKRAALHEELHQYFIDKKQIPTIILPTDKPKNARYLLNNLPVYNAHPKRLTQQKEKNDMVSSSKKPNRYFKFQPRPQKNRELVENELSLMKEFSEYSLRVKG